MRNFISSASLIAFVLVAYAAIACSSAQKAEEKQIFDCAVVDLQAVTHELEGSDSALVKGTLVSADAYSCWQQARAAGKLAGSGSAGSGSAK